MCVCVLGKAPSIQIHFHQVGHNMGNIWGPQCPLTNFLLKYSPGNVKITSCPRHKKQAMSLQLFPSNLYENTVQAVTVGNTRLQFVLDRKILEIRILYTFSLLTLPFSGKPNSRYTQLHCKVGEMENYKFSLQTGKSQVFLIHTNCKELCRLLGKV